MKDQRHIERKIMQGLRLITQKLCRVGGECVEFMRSKEFYPNLRKIYAKFNADICDAYTIFSKNLCDNHIKCNTKSF